MPAASERPGRQVETTASNLLLEALAGEVVEALRAAGRRSVLLKGVTTARWLYDDDLRAYGDVDLLVDPTGFHDCERLLEGLGFERSPIERAFVEGRPQHASTWIRGSATVDLHRTLVGVGVPAEEAWAVLSENSETWEVGRAQVEVLNAAARSLVLALHVAQHGAGFGQGREDLERAVAQVPALTWEAAANLARHLRAETSMAAGLLSVRGGPQVCDALGLHLEGEAAVEGSPDFHAAQGLLWFMETKGVQAKARYASSKLFPPAAVMRARVPSARAGRVALISAYGARLVRVVWYAPRAGREVMRVRRRRPGS